MSTFEDLSNDVEKLGDVFLHCLRQMVNAECKDYCLIDIVADDLDCFISNAQKELDKLRKKILIKVWKVVQDESGNLVSARLYRSHLKKTYANNKCIQTVDECFAFTSLWAAQKFVIEFRSYGDQIWEAECESVEPVQTVLTSVDSFPGQCRTYQELMEYCQCHVAGSLKIAPEGTVLCKNLKLTEFVETSQ